MSLPCLLYLLDLLIHHSHKGYVKTPLHAIVQMRTIGQTHMIRVTLPVKHAGEAFTFLAFTATPITGLDHYIAFRHVVIFHMHFHQVIQKMMKCVSASIMLHAPLVPSAHLRHHVPYQSQGQAGHDVFPIAEFLLGERKPERQPHAEDAMTHVSHGSKAPHVEGYAYSLDFLGGHGNVTHPVMFEEAILDLIRFDG